MVDPYALLQSSQVSVPGLISVYENTRQRRMDQMLMQRKIALEDKELERKDKLLNIYSRVQRPGQAGEKPPVSGMGTAYAPQPASQPASAPSDAFGSFYDHFLAPAEGGYVASDGRSGAPANFGINQKYHQGAGHEDHSNVRGITPEIARRVAHDEYWTVSGADKIEDPRLQAIHADSAFNMGPDTAKRMLEASGGDPDRYLDLREQHYRKLGGKDLPGWLKRNERLEAYVNGLGTGQGGPAVEAAPVQAVAPPQTWLAANKDLIGEMMTVDPTQAFQLAESFSKMDKAQLDAASANMERIGSIAMHLLSFPPEERPAELNRLAPQLAGAGIDASQLAEADLTDNGLQGYVAQALDVEKIIDKQDRDRRFNADQDYRRETLGLSRKRLEVSEGALDVARQRASKGDSENSDLSYLMGGE